MRVWALLQRQRGNLPLIVLFAVLCFATIAGLSLYFSKGGRTFASIQAASLFSMGKTDGIGLLKAQIEKALRDKDAIQGTLERNPNQFSCLFTEHAACRGKGGSIILFDSSKGDANALSQIVNGSGVSSEGRACLGYPSKSCSLRAEIKWSPVCGGTACENTKSMRLYVTIYHNEGSDSKLVPSSWKTEVLLSPELHLSERVSCLRKGGHYVGGNCVTAGSERMVASSVNVLPAAPALPPPVRAEQKERAELVCPRGIMVNGVEYEPDMATNGRAEVRVEAMNGCPAFDVYTFQCAPDLTANKTDRAISSEENQGQWIQVGASMAPTCDEYGNPRPFGNGAPAAWQSTIPVQ